MHKVRASVQSEFRISYNPHREIRPQGDVWLVRELGDEPEQRFVREFKIEGSCYSVYAPLEHGGACYFQLGCRGFAHWMEDSVRIVSLRREEVIRGLNPRTQIRVRYNTDRNRDPSRPPWRVLVGNGPVYEETLVSTFVISGVSYSTNEVLPNIGKKCHVSCRGSVRFYDDHADIFSHE